MHQEDCGTWEKDCIYQPCLLEYKGNWYLLEANMQYGREGFKRKNMVLKEVIRQKLLEGSLLD